MPSALKKTGKWILRILVTIIGLLLMVWGMLQTQWGKNLVKDLAVSYLKKKLKTEVAIQSINLAWFNHIKLTGIHLEDQQKRKLGYIGLLETSYDISNILSGSLTLSSITIDNAQFNLFRERNDSTFNFGFITNAFSSQDDSKDTSSKPFMLSLGKINLSHLQFVMADLYGGQSIQFSLGTLKSNIRHLDLQAMKIAADYLFTDSVYTTIRLFSGANKNTAPPSNTAADTSSSPLIVTTDSIHLGNTVFSLQNRESGLDVQTNAASLAVGKMVYNQQLLNVHIGRITLNNHSSVVKIKSKPAPAAKKADMAVVKAATKPFTFLHCRN